MDNTARDNILGRLKKFRQPQTDDFGQNSPADERAAEVLARELTDSIDLPPGSELNATQKIERFINAIETAHAEVIKTSRAQWTEDLHKHLKENNIANLLYAPGGGDGDLGNIIKDDAIELIPFNQPVENFKDELFNKIDAGISYASCGIAHTGTLIVKTGPDEPRTMSLVPPVHYVWLDSKSMYSNLTEAFADPEVSSALPTNLLLISGPSKTADIQQTLAYGAHGPKRLIILLVD